MSRQGNCDANAVIEVLSKVVFDDVIWNFHFAYLRWNILFIHQKAAALLHESSLARTMPTDRILTCRCGMTLVGRGRSSD